jgi:hypothetical protein
MKHQYQQSTANTRHPTLYNQVKTSPTDSNTRQYHQQVLDNGHPTTSNMQQPATAVHPAIKTNSRQPTANNLQPTANNLQPTANNRQPTTDSW